MNRISVVLAVVCWFTVAHSLHAGDLETEKLDNWHQWRGPLATGVAPHGNPPTTWDESTNIKWKVEIPGDGDATPVIWGNKVFIVTAVPTERKEEKPPAEVKEVPGGNPFKIERPTNFHKFIVMCFDRQTGNKLWEKLATEQVPHEGHHKDHGFASSTPTTDGQHLYVSFGSRGFYCYDMDGNLKWERDLGDLFIIRWFGETVTPVLHGDNLVVTWDHEGGSALYVLDPKTGETKWQVPREEHTSWATPLVIDYNGRTQVIVSSNLKVRAYDLADGKVIWECGGQTLACIPTPVANDHLVFVMSGYPGNALYAIPLDSEGDITGTDKIAWKTNEKITPYCPSPVLTSNGLFFNKTNAAILACLNPENGEKLIINQRIPGVKNIYASPVAAAGRIYFVGRDGATTVIADSTDFQVLSENKLDNDIDASPAIVGSELFLRGRSKLYCISEQ